MNKFFQIFLYFSSPYRNRMEEKNVKWFVALCYDVFLEVLRYGNRRQLVTLERVGRRIHRIVENYFGETPFLRLNLLLEPRFSIFTILFSHFCDNLLCYRHFGHGLSACINYYAEIEASHLNVEYFPSFFRFNKIDIYFSTFRIWDTQPIAGKCQLLEDQLKLIKPALNGPILYFNIIIDQSNPSCFYDHDQVLESLRNRLLPICDKSRGYEFWIGFYLDANTIRFIIASILQMDQIDRCSNVVIDFSIEVENGTKLPIEEISNWLHRSCNGGGHRERRERFLFICTELKALLKFLRIWKRSLFCIFANLKSLKSILSALSAEL